MIHLISFTKAGFSFSQQIQNLLLQNDFSESEISLSYGGKIFQGEEFPHIVALSEWVEKNFQKENALIFVGAAGIAVRAISPFVKSKILDPAVLVIDEKGEFVIPILSGHIGGANDLARKIANLLGGIPVITTASDVNNLPAIDEFAKKNNLAINDMKFAKEFTARFLNFNYCDDERSNVPVPKFTITIYIKNYILSLIPKCLILGVGCKKGKSSGELENFIFETLKSQNIDYRSLEKIASIDLKKDENAIIAFSQKYSLPFVCFSTDELNKIPQKVSHSDFVLKITGTDNVCERAVFAAGANEILIPKISQNGMTLAFGIRKIDLKIPEELKKFFVNESEE